MDRAQASPLRSSPRVLLCPDNVTSLPPGAVKWDVAAGGPGVGGQPPHPLVIAPLAFFTGFLESPLSVLGHRETGRLTFSLVLATSLTLSPSPTFTQERRP